MHDDDDDVSKLSAIIAAQGTKLAHRLSELDLIDLNDDDEEEVGFSHWNDLDTGEIVVAIEVGESMYWEAGTQLIEQIEAPSGLWFRPLGTDGMPVDDWKRAGPPPAIRRGMN
jgi:hypothetical protein